ncbi:MULTISPECIES: N-carbamoylputrescine amidase [unclassified Novosphingobium]|uniref:N-carbamoylputrescine amidase n=1 Tax=unclassified Novosphingobium TaxID=2644732 RepID=UPI00149419FC|nr:MULTISPECIES: N-carbamoylputrescine amidase [unclassified Novosphingobium]MBB3357491.1 N-carbamoylputrescine amidase [Novosphingobium sp. BK256]MBB3373846.1 N-carbamoylputrescine amidase [Novosphingobium sp. BK280]MBB3378258.1 N-carbamoylputrescine amidase [Novosphingobium sp. BK258]MBB3419957.1 N-carbamoylputrescine amidase [Novosphingobium sp. BK267]MBB3447721.1 N-carbamoylputrescine amidase [Novosphingobium sp. BK352]
MRPVTVAATQFACTWDLAANLDRAEMLVREAAAQGAQVVLLQELFEAPYFCADERPDHFALARPWVGNPVIARFADLAAELGVVLPISFFESVGAAHFNTLAMIDADGTELGLYRKSHIPQGPGYREKYFFAPGDTGFQVWDTAFGRIGAGICWDQWFPECARALALQGAELILYPTAIGSEPAFPGYDSQPHWQRVMQGHAGANMVPVIASNRVGFETNQDGDITFYGSSFIADQFGAVVAQAPRQGEAVITASFDLDEIAPQRAGWGLFRDRRPELYGVIGTYGG